MASLDEVYPEFESGTESLNFDVITLKNNKKYGTVNINIKNKIIKSYDYKVYNTKTKAINHGKVSDTDVFEFMFPIEDTSNDYFVIVNTITNTDKVKESAYNRNFYYIEENIKTEDKSETVFAIFYTGKVISKEVQPNVPTYTDKPLRETKMDDYFKSSTIIPMHKKSDTPFGFTKLSTDETLIPDSEISTMHQDSFGTPSKSLFTKKTDFDISGIGKGDFIPYGLCISEEPYKLGKFADYEGKGLKLGIAEGLRLMKVALEQKDLVKLYDYDNELRKYNEVREITDGIVINVDEPYEYYNTFIDKVTILVDDKANLYFKYGGTMADNYKKISNERENLKFPFEKPSSNPIKTESIAKLPTKNGDLRHFNRFNLIKTESMSNEEIKNMEYTPLPLKRKYEKAPSFNIGNKKMKIE